MNKYINIYDINLDPYCLVLCGTRKDFDLMEKFVDGKIERKLTYGHSLMNLILFFGDEMKMYLNVDELMIVRKLLTNHIMNDKVDNKSIDKISYSFSSCMNLIDRCIMAVR